MHRVLTWPRVWWPLAFSFSGLFLSTRGGIRDTPVGEWAMRISATIWIVWLVVLLPIRVFLDRREARLIRIQMDDGAVEPSHLSVSQRATIVHQTMKYPRGLRWLGSRTLEVILWALVVIMALMIVIPLCIWLVLRLLRQIVP